MTPSPGRSDASQTTTRMAATPTTAATPFMGKRGSPKTRPSKLHKRKGKFKATGGDEEMIKIEEELGI
ncbi:hypothetical protein PG988_007427 [Apiospora saccharicola]